MMKTKIRSHFDCLFIKRGMSAIILMACSCSSSPEQNNKKVEKDPVLKHVIVKKPPSSFEDTVIVDRESAVFYNPDSLQLEKIKLVNEKNVYGTMTHDCFY